MCGTGNKKWIVWWYDSLYWPKVSMSTLINVKSKVTRKMYSIISKSLGYHEKYASMDKKQKICDQISEKNIFPVQVYHKPFCLPIIHIWWWSPWSLASSLLYPYADVGRKT